MVYGMSVVFFQEETAQNEKFIGLSLTVFLFLSLFHR
jgi:hypothetical protein